MLGLTPKQKECLDFIRAYIEAHGASPSYQNIMDAMGLRSKSGVHRLVHALHDRGHLVTEHGLRRAIAVRDRSEVVRAGHGLSLTLPGDVVKALRAHASTHGMTPAAVIREAVAAYVGEGA